MKSKMQKDAFLNGEGDQYFIRNKNKNKSGNFVDSVENYSDPLIPFILDLPLAISLKEGIVRTEILNSDNLSNIFL